MYIELTNSSFKWEEYKILAYKLFKEDDNINWSQMLKTGFLMAFILSMLTGKYYSTNTKGLH